MKIMVLAGGPDRERPVSLKSGQSVSGALCQAGHEVRLHDIGPDDLSALEESTHWGGDVIFPVLHGPWGEGGALQAILDQRSVPYVGSTETAARLCMDKQTTKQALLKYDLLTPDSRLVRRGQTLGMHPPLVIKPLREGSSFGVAICHQQAEVGQALDRLFGEYDELLVETFIAGKELTVGVIDEPGGSQALEPIEIAPTTPFYDYQAKYDRSDTRYLVGAEQIDLPAAVLENMQQVAERTHRLLGCRHVSRVDFIVDRQHQPWILEVNTMPGFTDHSLLPKAAAHAGIPLSALVDSLVQLAVRGPR